MDRAHRALRRSQMVKEIQEGEISLRGAVEKFRVCESTIRNACRDADIDLSKAKDLLAQHVVADVLADKELRAICGNRAVGEDFVRKCCEEQGVATGPIPERTDQTFGILANLLNTDDSLAAIAQKFKTSVSTISRIYIKALEQGMPLIQRKPGRHSDPARTKPCVCISFDEAVELNQQFFSVLTRSLFLVSTIYIVASAGYGSQEQLEGELQSQSIRFHVAAIASSKGAYFRRHNASVVIDNRDENIAGLPESVLVLKVRDIENYCFEEKKWLYSETTGIEV